MPIYEYACTDCGHKLEVMQKMNDLPLKECPACNQNTLKKLISAAAFHLKGTGWYETDFKGKKKQAETTTEKEKTEKEKTEKEKTGKEKTETSSSVQSTSKSQQPAKTDS
ncbi:MAG TPA: zinc ribbon domain-containing protein [Thiotrichaceae bacterium]|nr:zinc ribbon domain-containing protein [Thiotrichaceae bacterium]